MDGVYPLVCLLSIAPHTVINITNAIITAPFRDCYDINQLGVKLPGEYTIQVTEETSTPVFCMEDGWTVIQSRGQFGNPKDYFYQPWNTYLEPFGTPGKIQSNC
jgi:hypothetical protein